MEKVIFKGFIRQSDYCDNSFTTVIGNKNTPISMIFYENFDGENVTARYFISETEKSIEELEENLILTSCGCLHADYSDRYSEITGYLWTDEEIMIGCHDLLSEINENIGKYIYLELTIH